MGPSCHASMKKRRRTSQRASEPNNNQLESKFQKGLQQPLQGGEFFSVQFFRTWATDGKSQLIHYQPINI